MVIVLFAIALTFRVEFDLSCEIYGQEVITQFVTNFHLFKLHQSFKPQNTILSESFVSTHKQINHLDYYML